MSSIAGQVQSDDRDIVAADDFSGETDINSNSRNDSDSSTIDDINFVAYGIVANIIVTVGIIGNILNLIVLSRPKLKGVMYVYLMGLAVSNLCVLIIAIPALMDIAGLIRSKTFSTAFFQAHLEIPLLNSFMAASVYIIICMTVNRYISIYKPTQFQRFHTFRNAYIAIFLSFLGGMFLHIPLAFEYSVAENCTEAEEEAASCTYSPDSNETVAGHVLFPVYIWISEALLRFGPIMTLTILNILIIVKFHRIAMKREVLKGGHRRSSAASNPPPSPFYPGPVSSAVSSSNATTSTSASSGVYGKRLSVANGKRGSTHLAVPADAPTSSMGYHSQATNDLTSTAEGISRAASPLPTSPSPSRLLRGSRGGASIRASHKRRGLHNPEERMLVVVLIAIVILFVVCTTPAAILSILLVNAELKKEVWFAIFRACANNLELLCFALNFFVYCLCSADIRRAFVDVLFENPMVQYVRRKSSFSKAGNIEMPGTTVHAPPENV